MSSAAEAARAATEGAAAPAGQFSMELSDDQRDVRDWVRGFAQGVVRPAAAEWDEREETPWPVIQEAAKIGLYGFEAIAQFWSDPAGLQLPIVNEELFWGDAGIGMSIMGTTLAESSGSFLATPNPLPAERGTQGGHGHWGESSKEDAQALSARARQLTP